MPRFTHVLAALCALIPSISTLSAQPAVVPTGEGQIGETPAADDQLIGNRFESIRGQPGDVLLGGLFIFGGAMPPTPEMSFVTDIINGTPNPNQVDTTNVTFDQIFAVTPASARARAAANDGDFVAFSFAADGTMPQTMTVNVATFDETGTPLASVPIPNVSNLGLPETGIAVDDQGRVTVAYTEFPTSGTPPVRVNLQRLDAITGAPLGSPLELDNRGTPDVALLDPAGDRLVIATSNLFTGDIDGHVLDTTGGTPTVGPSFPISTTGGFINILPKVAADTATGAFTVAWENLTNDTEDPVNVRARRFDAMGNPIGDDFLVNTTTDGAQGQPALAVGPDGESTIVWAADGMGVEDLDVFMQVYDAIGNPIGGETRVNTFTDDIQDRPTVRFLPEPDGQGRTRLTVVWRDVGASDGTQARGTGSSYRSFGLETPIFEDGFESGDTTSWSTTQQ